VTSMEKNIEETLNNKKGGDMEEPMRGKADDVQKGSGALRGKIVHC